MSRKSGTCAGCSSRGCRPTRHPPLAPELPTPGLPGALVVDRNAVSARIPTESRPFGRERCGSSTTPLHPTHLRPSRSIAVTSAPACRSPRRPTSTTGSTSRRTRSAARSVARRSPRRALGCRRPCRPRDPVAPPADGGRSVSRGGARAARPGERGGQTEGGARHAYDRYQRIVRTELHAEPARARARYEAAPAGVACRLTNSSRWRRSR